MSEATVYRRLRDPSFRQELDRRRDELLTLTTTRLAQLADSAIRTLEELLGPETPAPQRLGAAREVLRFLGELGASRDVLARLERLEEQAGLDPATGWRSAA